MESVDLISELLRVGIKIPEGCADAQVIVSTNGTPEIRFTCTLTKEQLPKVSKAVAEYNRKLEAGWDA